MEEISYNLKDYSYDLPEGLIARYPARERQLSRLMVVKRKGGVNEHRRFYEIAGFMEKGDALILNNTRVFPARLIGKRPTGGKVEALLLHFPQELRPGIAQSKALLRSSKPLRRGTRIHVGEDLFFEVAGNKDEGLTRGIRLYYSGLLSEALERHGHIPLPPYIKRKDEEMDRYSYQTVYARQIGSVAAPTAGLHFTNNLLDSLKKKGVHIGYVTLHVGYGTFAPVRAEDIRRHVLHREWIDVGKETIELVECTRRRGGRVFCAGTTTVRAVEYVFSEDRHEGGYAGPCDLYIYPGYDFKVTDALITNFHLPMSSLLILVAAFAGRERILSAYKEAIGLGYRFYSYGDAMLIL